MSAIFSIELYNCVGSCSRAREEIKDDVTAFNARHFQKAYKQIRTFGIVKNCTAK